MYACQVCLPRHLWSARSTYGLLCLAYGLLCLTSRSSAFCNQLSSMPLYYAYLGPLLCLPSLLCLLLPSMPTRSPAPVSTYTESICVVILPRVLPSLLPTVVFLYTQPILYIWSPMPTLSVMTKCLLCPYAFYAHSCGQHCLPGQLWSALLCLPGLFCLLYLLHLLCLRAFPVTYALSYQII